MKQITYLISIVLLASCATKKVAINKSQTKENKVFKEEPKATQKYNFDSISYQFKKQLIAQNYTYRQRYKFLDDSYSQWEMKDTETKVTGTLDVILYGNTLSDFNKDGISDIWVKIKEVQVTANYSSHQIGILQISNNKPLKFIEYFQSGDDHSTQQDIVGWKNKKPLIKINKNPNPNRVNNFNFIEDNIIELGFNSKTRKLISLSYERDCEMSKMENKTIFLDVFERYKKKDTLSFFERGNFTVNFSDNIINNHQDVYFGQISGCNNLKLYMSSILKYDYKPEKKLVIKNFLDFMIDATRFETIFKKIKTHYYLIGLKEQDKLTKTDKGWQYYIEIDRFPNEKYDKVYLWYYENNYRSSK